MNKNTNNPSSNPLTHFDQEGQAHMVDVSAKAATHRSATAEGCIFMLPSTFEHIQKGQANKGDVLGIARVAGIMGAKQTASLVPLCHPIPLTRVAIDFEFIDEKEKGKTGIRCTATTETVGITGVEMESLTAVQIALLTIYDMCKAVDRGMEMHHIRLLEKKGGKSGHFKVDYASSSD